MTHRQDEEGNTCMHLACLNVDLEEVQQLYTKSTELVHSLDTRKRLAATAAENDALNKGAMCVNAGVRVRGGGVSYVCMCKRAAGGDVQNQGAVCVCARAGVSVRVQGGVRMCAYANRLRRPMC